MAEEQRYIATVDVDTDRDDLGVQKIAFTANPAIIIKGVAFAAEQPDRVQAKDAVKMRIVAPVLVPSEIYRKADGGHTLIFTEEEIAGIQQDFMKRLNNANPLFKKEHTDKGTSPAYILETWIVEDPKTDKANTVFNLDVPAGSWIVIVQVTDRDYYDGLVKDGATGFSIEGFLGHKLELSIESAKGGKMKIKQKEDGVKLSKVESVYKWEQEVENETFNVGDKITYKNDAGQSLSVGAGEYELEDGRSAVTDADGVIQVIKEVKMADEKNEEAVKVALPDGTYTDADGKTFKVKDGVVVKEEAMSEEDGEEVEMADEELEDGTTISIEGELKEGAKTTAKDGDHKTKSGKVVTVKDGVVATIKEAEPEELEDEAGTPTNTYTKEEVDALIEGLREEFAQKWAEMELKIEGKTENGDSQDGEKVEMSKEERAVAGIVSLREAYKNQ